MKPLFSFLAALVLGVPASAQIEMGVNGGIIRSAAFVTDDYTSKSKFSAFRPGISVTGMYNVRNWRFGISAGYQREKITYTYDVPVGCFGYDVVTKTTVENFIPLTLVASRKFTFRRFETYCGITTGIVSRTTRYSYSMTDANGTVTSHDEVFMGGLHIGMTRFVSKHIGINAEVGANYMMVRPGNIKYDPVSYPVLLGIQYRL